MGFCLFNNVAVAARAYQARSSSRAESKDTVLVVDFDYHHGNGTEAVAGNGLSYVSTHAYPAYPGTGTASFRRGDDPVVNVPLPVEGVDTETFVAVWETLLDTVAAAVRPTLIVVSAGFDYVKGDRVGDLGVAAEAAAPIAAAIRRAAIEHCSGAVAYVLEGGYEIDALAASIASIAGASDAPRVAARVTAPGAVPEKHRRQLAASLRILQGTR